ncbi:hypothetical protein D0C36_01960 [Mucilaginibacter conchicola]|uniref:Uncharacterized protein n=1 Tax=Mucilaginibacter conchicola TaxID=2303333 RepID=A0A372NW61_9SPHI|nr:DUF6694 family lipoprotein [Mucilaginibacter conchicola]RFZ94346.1 hypothetical protein D0C36_01960 [Mucilaginibacter conchicola]
MKITYLPIALILIILLSSCGPRIDGSSEKASKASYEKMKAGLSDEDQSKLDLAILYITGSAMYDKMHDVKEYKDLSFEKIVLKKIDGKTKGGIFDLAEEFMKQDKERQIKSAQDEITELNKTADKERKDYDAIRQKTEMLKGSFVKMTLENGMPMIYCQFKNVTADKMFDAYSLSLLIRSIDKNHIIWNSTTVRSGVGTIKPGDTFDEKMDVSQYSMDNAPEINWKAIKYPVTDLAKYNLEVEAKTTSLFVDDKEYSLDTVKWDRDSEINYRAKLKELNADLKKAKSKPDNLDDELKRGG